ncbi:MAG: hypothetical protein FJY56_10520 [Betaproteobacteria bacterium]|nr:hypothetical protein [Betaproteobacteria bacterium]
MDRAIWAHWYDLPGGDAGYLNWLHQTFMPKILSNRGVLWAAHYEVQKKPKPHHINETGDAVGKGNDYILLFGAEDTHAFSRDAASYTQGKTDRWSAQYSDQDKAMLARRAAVRSAIMTEEARVPGPACGSREGLRLPAPCIQLGSFNGPTPEIEQELLAWYADWRMSALSKLPGCVGMRKLVSTVGWNKHGVIYEFTSLEARVAGMAQVATLYPEQEAWTHAAVPRLVHAFGSPHIGQRIAVLEK